MKISIGRHMAQTFRKVGICDKADGVKIGWGHRSEASGTIEAEIEVTIDVEKLARALATLVLVSKGKKTTLKSGAIVLRVKPGTERTTEIPHVHTDRCRDLDGQLICGVGIKNS